MLLAMLLVPSVVLWVSVILIVSVIPLRELLRHMRSPALEVDVHPARVFLCGVL